jgi:alpha-glucosidase
MPWSYGDAHAGFTSGKPWLPIPDDHVARAVDRQDADPGSLLNTWRRFLHWRKSHEALRTGDLRVMPTPAPFIAFERFNDKQRILVVLNFSDQAATLSLKELGDVQPLDALGGAPTPANGRLELRGWGTFLGALPATNTAQIDAIRSGKAPRNNFSIKRA